MLGGFCGFGAQRKRLGALAGRKGDGMGSVADGGRCLEVGLGVGGFGVDARSALACEVIKLIKLKNE